MHTPKLSYIVPAYNTAHWLEECLASIAESASDMECIVIDDGQTRDFPPPATEGSMRRGAYTCFS